MATRNRTELPFPINLLQRLLPQPKGPAPMPSPTRPVRPPKPKGMVMNRDLRQSLVEVAAQIADKYGLPRKYFIAQIQAESGFNPSARGKAGEIGIAQIIPRYHPNVNPHDPVASMEYLAQFLVNTAPQLARIYGPDLALPAAMAAWNAGLPSVASRRIPAQTIEYLRRIFGQEVATELAARASGKPATPVPAAQAAAPGPGNTNRVQLLATQALREYLQRPSVVELPNPVLSLIMLGLMTLPPEIQQALPERERHAIQRALHTVRP